MNGPTSRLAVVTEYFTRQGYQVVTATNGVEAMFQTQRWLPKAIILDLFMPRLGGLGALDRIRRLVPEIVPILISGNPGALEMVTEAGISVAGAGDYLAKPVNRRELITRVQTTPTLKHTVDQKIGEPRATRDHFGKFVPETIKRLVAVNPETRAAKRKRDISVLFVEGPVVI